MIQIKTEDKKTTSILGSEAKREALSEEETKAICKVLTLASYRIRHAFPAECEANFAFNECVQQITRTSLFLHSLLNKQGK